MEEGHRVMADNQGTDGASVVNDAVAIKGNVGEDGEGGAG